MRFLRPILLLLAALPAVAALPATATHRVQALVPGTGQPRVRDTSAGRIAPAQQRQARPTGRTLPYRPAKPGEGAPKD